MEKYILIDATKSIAEISEMAASHLDFLEVVKICDASQYNYNNACNFLKENEGLSDLDLLNYLEKCCEYTTNDNACYYVFSAHDKNLIDKIKKVYINYILGFTF